LNALILGALTTSDGNEFHLETTRTVKQCLRSSRCEFNLNNFLWWPLVLW